MTKPKKPAAPKPLTIEQIAKRDPFADGAAPGLGGAWIRNADGDLVRDADTEQPIPDGEGTVPEQPPVLDAPPPPVGDLTTETKER